MLRKLLNRLGFDVKEALLKNTNKVWGSYYDIDCSIIKIGCAVDKWSSLYPMLIIENKVKKRLKRFKSKSIKSAYKKALLKDADYGDLRKCRFNFYEECGLRELFGEEIKNEILDVYNELKQAEDRKSFLRGKS